MMGGSYQPALVMLSIAVAYVASWIALDLSSHALTARGRMRETWTAGGAVALGIGLWSMHLLGMLSFRFRGEGGVVPVAYDLLLLAFSLLVAVSVSLVTISLAVGRSAGAWSPAGGGVLCGLGIGGVHLIVLSAMRVPAVVTEPRPAVLVAVGLAATGGALAFHSTFRRNRPVRDVGPVQRRRLAVAAALLAAGAAGMHYTALAAVVVTPTGAPLRLQSNHVLATGGMAAVVAASALAVLGLAVAGLVIERRVGERLRGADAYSRLYRDAEAARQVVEESERRFRSLVAASAQVIWIADARGLIDDSPLWRDLTGQSRDEVRGFGWMDALHPEDRMPTALAWQRAIDSASLFETEYRVRVKEGNYCWYLARGVPVLEFGGAVREWVGTCTDIDEHKRAEAAEQLLLEAARTLASSLDLRTTLHAVAQLVIPRFGDFCLVHLEEPDGSFQQAASAHVDPAKAPLLEELGNHYRPGPAETHGSIARVLMTSTPLLIDAPPDDEAALIFRDPTALRIHHELAPVSCIIIPLVARGHLFGVLSVASSVSGRRQDVQDRALVELLGARAALAIDNARLYTEASEARDRALRAMRLEAELTQARLETLRAQLNPHFLFNALNTIAMLVRRKATSDALRAVVSLSELLRKVLAGGGALEVSLREELAVVEHYLSVEKLRFRDHLAVEVVADPETLDALVPSFILQPLVENAVRHGAARGVGDSRVRLECHVRDDRIHIEIHDAGPGFPDGWDPSTSGGLGLANTRERLQRMYGDDQLFEVRNGRTVGAMVRMEIPLHTAPAARAQRSAHATS